MFKKLINWINNLGETVPKEFNSTTDICHDFISQGWGHALHWGNRIPDTNIWNITAHSFRIPKKGEFFKTKMDSGKIGIFYLENVERFYDPEDMWKARVRFFCYG